MAAKEPRDFTAARQRRRTRRRSAPSPRTDLRAAYSHTEQAGAPRRGRRRQGEGHRRELATRRRREPGVEGAARRGLQGPRDEDRARERPRRPASASTAATSRPSARSSPRSASCRARTARRCSPAARRRRWSSRPSAPATTSSTSTRCEGTYKETLPAALQLPALLGRRDGPHGLARPSRDRPRQARLARHPPDAADGRRVPLHHPRRLRDHRVERLVLDGDRLRHLARADGRRRAAQARRWPASPWA